MTGMGHKILRNMGASYIKTLNESQETLLAELVMGTLHASWERDVKKGGEWREGILVLTKAAG